MAGEGDGDVLGGELSEGEEAEGAEVGEGFVEVPDELGEARVVGRGGELELVVVGAEVVGDEAGVGELVAFVGFAEADAEGLDGFASCVRAISATIRLESRPPESIAPSGTSLIRRSRTASSSSSSSRSAYSCSLSARLGVGGGVGQ